MAKKISNPEIGSVVRIFFHDCQLVGLVTDVGEEYSDDFRFLDLSDLQHEANAGGQSNNDASWELLIPSATVSTLIFTHLAEKKK